MKEAGMYEKFSDDCPLLRDFKKYLRESLKVPNCQQEVDNVSRFLRFAQPSGDEPTLDFLTRSTETRDFLTRLHNTSMTAATILNYIKNIIRFMDYLKTRLDLGQRDAQLREKCQSFKEMLQTLRKPISKSHSQEVCKTRYTNFVEGSRSVAECQEVLRVANRDFLSVYGRLISNGVVSESEKTMYRYYCEAIMVLRQFQRPGAVEGMTETEWVNRKHVDGHCVIGISKHKTATQQIASFTLNQEEEAWFQEYFEKIRPTYLSEYCERFFIASNGKPHPQRHERLRSPARKLQTQACHQPGDQASRGDRGCCGLHTEPEGGCLELFSSHQRCGQSALQDTCARINSCGPI
ncbi:uncharacterized protein LOC111194629 [Astyanax mexicanus]|uniref:uncharacterized protein LOC111194629 n=1 Tax=Astyanax mexicanus TaxID=7994 RepID=UPI0020CB2789|nr:uncharacterized protein LOC111194629 [Astyanax mexicanus]